MQGVPPQVRAEGQHAQALQTAHGWVGMRAAPPLPTPHSPPPSHPHHCAGQAVGEGVCSEDHGGSCFCFSFKSPGLCRCEPSAAAASPPPHFLRGRWKLLTCQVPRLFWGRKPNMRSVPPWPTRAAAPSRIRGPRSGPCLADFPPESEVGSAQPLGPALLPVGSVPRGWLCL